MRIVVLYHASCHDGFGAAWATWKKFGDSAEYRAVQYGDAPPCLDGPLQLYILDFSYSREAIEEMKVKYGRLVVIDHHKSAMNALAGVDDTIFDMNKSAAVLAWEHLFPNISVPELLRYVQDYDLWKFELPDSKEVSAALGSYPLDFSVWNSLEPDVLAADGRPLLRLQTEMVKTICDEARLERIETFVVPVVNTTVHGSEVGEELLRRHPKSPFSVSYNDRADGLRHWSLRSRSDFDVSLVAKKFGGGGHKQAAGFETSLPKGSVVKS